MKRRHILSCILLLLSLSACGSRGEMTSVPAASVTPAGSPAPSPEIIQVEKEDLRPEELKILCAKPDGVGSDCYAEIFETLYCMDGDALQPLLASAQPEEGANAGEYRIILRSDIRDSTGQRYTAANAAEAYSGFGMKRSDGLFRYAKEDENGSLLLCFGRELNETEKKSWFCAVPLYAEREIDGVTHLVGTGPYTVSEQNENDLLLLPNADYWGDAAEKQNVKSIRCLFISEPSEQVIALELGKADMANGLSYEDAEDFRTGGSYNDLFTTAERCSREASFLLPNLQKGSGMETEEARLALFGLLDCETLAKKLGGRVCLGLGNPDFELYQVNGQSYQTVTSTSGDTQNRDWNKKGLTLLCLDARENKRIAEAIKNQLESKGVYISILAQDESDYAAALDEGKIWDLALVVTAGSDSPVSQWLELWNYKANSKILRGHQSDATLMNLLQTVSDAHKADRENIGRLQERVFNHGYALALPQVCRSAVVPLYVSKVVTNANGALLPGSCEFNG